MTAAWAGGALLYGLGGPGWFWRVLAYVAVLHFVRQQYGWLALYRACAGDQSRLGAIIDRSAIYLATLYPLLYWHAHLPRSFAWFMPGDFVGGVPAALADAALWLYVAALGAYVVRASVQLGRGEQRVALRRRKVGRRGECFGQRRAQRGPFDRQVRHEVAMAARRAILRLPRRVR